MLTKAQREQWTEWARRDDAFTLFVPSDLRQMLGEIDRLHQRIAEQKEHIERLQEKLRDTERRLNEQVLEAIHREREANG